MTLDTRRGESDEEGVFLYVDRVAEAPQQSSWGYFIVYP